MSRCPCDSGLDYVVCCEVFHRGVELPVAAEKLMRSRYSAYVLQHTDYLLRTWHPSTRPANLDLAAEDVVWLGLEIIETKQGTEKDDEGLVEFVARSQGGQLHERSRFIRESGQWYYRDGTLLPPVLAVKPGRNGPCPCGSGKKFKKCCG
ncbi:YchJ family protein [Sedimenticola sp.]|uniref:YchJ family protein n=1 Tax=Sedimenticola sp. TaxID=1940285 RepID=UPI003D0E203F